MDTVQSLQGALGAMDEALGIAVASLQQLPGLVQCEGLDCAANHDEASRLARNLQRAGSRYRGKGRGAGWANAPFMQLPQQSAACEFFDLAADDAEEAVSLVPSGDPYTALSACEKSDETESSAILPRGQPPEVTTYNLCISACEKEVKGHKEEAMELCADSQQGDINPEVTTHTALTGACEKGNKVEKALELHGEMQLRGSDPEVATYTDLTSACEKGGKTEKAMELLAEMQQSGLSTCSALISACEQEDVAEMAMELHVGMQLRGLDPEVATYTDLTNAREKSGKTEKTKELLAAMQQRGLSTCSALFSACEQEDMAEKAMELHAGMQQRGLEPITTVVAHKCKKKRKGHKGSSAVVKKATELDADSQQPVEYHRPSWVDIRGSEPNVTTYLARISACLKDNEVDKAMELVAEMIQGGLITEAVVKRLFSGELCRS